MDKKELTKKIWAYALKNAIEHNGNAIPGKVLNSLFHEGLDKSKSKETMPLINEITEKVNKLSIEEKTAKFSELEQEVGKRPEREGMPELESTEDIATRFSPSPSGPMHIGHAATGMPSSLYAKKYNGKFYLRIEDTNPANIEPAAYKMIPEEADWLFGNVAESYAQSDRMLKYYDFAEQLITKNAAYICDCDPEEFKKLIEQQKPCPCRFLDSTEHLKRWKRMLDKKGYEEGKAVLRFKSDLDDPNPALRDFPLARIVTEKHPKQKNKYRVWPLMNLCVTLDDMEFNITHIIRGKEHQDNAKRQAMMFKVFNKPIPHTYFLGRYKFTDLEISCSKTKELINKGKFSGWEDIRLPFIAPLKKRGYQAEAFRQLAVQRGLSDVDKVITKEDYFQLLNNLNREIIKNRAIQAEIRKKSKTTKEFTLRTPDNKTKKVHLDISAKVKDGDIVHLKDLGYCKLNGNEFWFAHE